LANGAVQSYDYAPISGTYWMHSHVGMQEQVLMTAPRTVLLGGSMKPYAWSMDGEMWPHITPLMVRQGQRVEFELVNRTMMAHPIHLHGHAFQVIALDGRPIQGAVRDTVLVMPGPGRVRIAFDANNPGRWAFHCHNLYHMQTGMMTEVMYKGIAA
jgi:FtsP/CotA-like multicopper oxidase with cupredoxin domain